MIEKKFNSLKKTLKFLRIYLGIITIMTIISILAIVFMANSIMTESAWPIFLIIITAILYFPCMFFILLYSSTKFPSSTKIKWNNALMILFLPLLGMWFWLPNKRELSKIKEKYYTQQHI